MSDHSLYELGQIEKWKQDQTVSTLEGLAEEYERRARVSVDKQRAITWIRAAQLARAALADSPTEEEE